MTNTDKRKIILSGSLDLSPVGRHGMSFFKTLSSNPQNEIYFDSNYVSKSDVINVLGENSLSQVKFTSKNPGGGGRVRFLNLLPRIEYKAG